MNYSSGDAAKIAGLSQVRINQLFARSAASGGIPLGNLRSPAGAHRRYDHIECVILSLACAVFDGTGDLAGPPMRDTITAIDDVRDVIEDMFVPEAWETGAREAQDSSDAVDKWRAEVRTLQERSRFWTDRGSDLWLALVVARYDSGELAGGLSIFWKKHGSILQLGASLAEEEARLRQDPYARLHHVFTFNLHAVVEDVARRAEANGLKFPPRRVHYGRDNHAALQD